MSGRGAIATIDGYDIYRADDADGADWDAALLELSGGSPFASFAGRAVLRDHFALEPCWLFACPEGRRDGISGCLAGYVNRDWVGRSNLYGVRQGLFAAAPAAANALATAARQLAATQRCSGIELSALAPISEADDAGTSRVTFRLALDAEGDAMWRQLRDKTRNMIRRAERDGVTVRELPHDNDAFALLAHHNEINLMPKGVAVPAAGYFAALCRDFGARAHILAAWYDGQPIASMLLLRHGSLAAYPVQNADPIHRRRAPIQLLTWQAMELCASFGCTQLDMGESGEGSPVYQAKRNFGGLPVVLHTLRESIGAAGHAGPLRRLRSVLDGEILRRAPLTLRRPYGRWRSRRGRVL
jgi:hypothetical protein